MSGCRLVMEVEQMGRFVNAGNGAFQVMLNSEIYVDKTGLLKYTNHVMDTTSKFICNSRPRRFGKSTTADMLTAYYSTDCDSRQMFEGLEISKTADFQNYLNRYDVIHLDIQWCLEPAGGPENVIHYITKNTISELREYYPQELPEDVHSLPEALSYINEATGKKFIVIIDEWDVMIRDESANKKMQDEYINFLRGMFKGSEPMKYIQLAYLTGILPIKKIKTQSALNNFEEFTMLDAGGLAEYIGFTEDEVKRLCLKYRQDFEKVKLWYDGYLLEKYQIYNPKAVVSLMKKGKFKSYWSETGTYKTIVPLINLNFDGLKSALIEMLAGEEVKVDVSSFQNDVSSFADRNDVLTYLIHLGYLGYREDAETAFIPNEEIRQELTRAISQKKWSEWIAFQKESQDLLEATLNMDTEAVVHGIEKIHMGYASAIQYNNENSLSSVLAIAYLGTMFYYFKPIREFPTGRGFADLIFIPKPEFIQSYPALVVELKWNETAKTALQQIKEKCYPESIRNYTGNLLLIGISYDKKTKRHECLIEADKKR